MRQVMETLVCHQHRLTIVDFGPSLKHLRLEPAAKAIVLADLNTSFADWTCFWTQALSISMMVD